MAGKRLVLVAVAAALMVAACGSSGPAPTPSPTAITGIESPIVVPGGQVIIVSTAEEQPTGGPTLVVQGTWLHVKGRVYSGSPDYTKLGNSVSITTADGTMISPTAATNGTPGWYFIIPGKVANLTMHFPGGYDVPLDSLLPGS